MASRLITLLLAVFTLAPAWAADPAVPFSGTDLKTGKTISLEDYRGKVVLIDFWASWCPPCLESLPAYERIRQELGPEVFEVIAINVDENTEDGVQFLEARPVSYPVLADPDGDIGKPYNVRSLPRAFLIDREGGTVKIYKRFRKVDEARLKKEIEALLN
jgi:thiol-disulfide isomerase/thioredoxin